MLDALPVPPRLILRALADLHTLAERVRRLTDLDDTAEKLEQSIDRLQAMLKKLPGI